MRIVVQHAALAEIVPLPIQLGNEVGLDCFDALLQRSFRLPVRGTERVGTLEHEMLQVVGSAQLSGYLVKGPHVGKYLRSHTKIPRAFQYQHAQSIWVNVLLDREIEGRWLLGADRPGNGKGQN